MIISSIRIGVLYLIREDHSETPVLHNVPHVINSRALTGEKPCINKAIHALLMHGYATFNMLVPGLQNCCRHEMYTALP